MPRRTVNFQLDKQPYRREGLGRPRQVDQDRAGTKGNYFEDRSLNSESESV